MSSSKDWYVRTADGNVYGPADVPSLVKWAEDGRIDASGFVSRDRMIWLPAQLMEELAMTWIVEVEAGKFLGPYNRKFLIASSEKGYLPDTVKLYRRHDLPIAEDPPPTIVEKEVIKEVPVEKIVEKIVEKVVEVEKPAKVTVVEAEVLEPVDAAPPPRVAGGVFGGADRNRLAALEEAAQRELAAAGKKRFGFLGRK